jgi:hypothetical protein
LILPDPSYRLGPAQFLKQRFRFRQVFRRLVNNDYFRCRRRKPQDLSQRATERRFPPKRWNADRDGQRFLN